MKNHNIEKEYSYYELIKLDTETLVSLFLKTRSNIIFGKKNKTDTTADEIYNCYIEKAIEEKM
mgnify:CR=1 FL=1|jgi:hypothetical protein